MMRHGALFNGIGGFQLAAHWMGWDNVMHCEIDEFCNKVVKKHFSNSVQHGDIKTTDFKKYRGAIDIITGGFPCQPYSTAGKRKGSEDDRHLWPEMLRAIREISPRWVVGENVRGLTNWNGGLVFDQVQADLETEGYEVLPFLLPACGVNAPHRRDRIWIIAHACSYGHQEWNPFEKGQQYGGGRKARRVSMPFGSIRVTSDTAQLTEREQAKEANTLTECRQTWIEPGSSSGGWDQFPTQSPVCGGDDGIPNWMDRLKSLGNAIVPQVAYQIFKAIEMYEND